MLESQPCVKLNLSRAAHRREYSADIVSEIPLWAREYGISTPSQRKWTLRITGDCKIRLIEQIVGFRAKRDLSAFRQIETFLERQIKLSERGAAQAIAASIAELTGSG